MLIIIRSLGAKSILESGARVINCLVEHLGRIIIIRCINIFRVAGVNIKVIRIKSIAIPLTSIFTIPLTPSTTPIPSIASRIATLRLIPLLLPHSWLAPERRPGSAHLLPGCFFQGQINPVIPGAHRLHFLARG